MKTLKQIPLHAVHSFEIIRKSFNNPLTFFEIHWNFSQVLNLNRDPGTSTTRTSEPYNPREGTWIETSKPFRHDARLEHLQNPYVAIQELTP